MSEVVLAEGARGGLVRSLQECLAGQGYPAGPIDGQYGFRTVAAVQTFQVDCGLAVSGETDQETWTAVTRLDPPTLRDRVLQLTAGLEGHAFSLARGNFSGAGITWGIIGFTLKSGEIQAIVKDALAQDRSLVENAFGDETPELLDVLSRPIPDQILWADRHSSGTYKMLLGEPWRSHFRTFGESPAVQKLQLDLIDEDYYEPALRTAAHLGMTSELGAALCFDVYVQNGGVRPAAAQEVAAKRRAGMPESDLRTLVATAVSSLARSEYRKDVLERKLAIAKGRGTIHGTEYVLRSWGLDESPAAEVACARVESVRYA